MSLLRATLMSSAMLVAVPLTASAQSALGFSGTFTLGYGFSSVGEVPGADIEYSGPSVDLQSEFMVSQNFGVGLDFSFSQAEFDVTGLPDIHGDIMSFEVAPTYYFGNGFYVGFYYGMADTDISVDSVPLTLGVDTETYGLFAGYETDMMWVEGFIGTSDTDPGLPADDVDIIDYGIAASYTVMPGLDIFGSLLVTDVDTSIGDGHLTGYSFGADYDFGHGFSLYGSFGFLTFGLPVPIDPMATGLTLGASYDLGAMAGTPVVLNVEYSRTTIDLDTITSVEPVIDRFAIGITIPLGGGASEPLNSNTRAARGDYRSAIGALANSL